MPLNLVRTLRQLAGVCVLGAVLVGCKSNPPAPKGPVSLPMASQRLSDDLLGQVQGNVLERLISRTVVLDPFIDAQSGQQTASSVKAANLVAQRLRARNTSLKLERFDGNGVEVADYLIAGTLRKTKADGSEYQMNATITERRNGMVIASAVARVRGSEIDNTPTAFYADSPSIVSDRVTKGYISTSQAAQGSAADQTYLASVSTGALINEATVAYDEGRWSDALLRYQAVVQRDDGKQLRVFNGLYNSHTKLGHTKEAEAAFAQIVALGLATNNLAVRLLFNPGSTDFWRDRAVSGIYPMWLRQIAGETTSGDYCMTVVGHTSKTGAEGTNDRLSQSRAKAVREMLVAQDRKLGERLDVDGMGWRENLIGSGTDDARDSLDRRVEFKVRNCKARGA
ncbi:MAG: OmpA family protein [Comamonas sp.]